MKKIIIAFTLFNTSCALHAEEHNPTPVKSTMTNTDLGDWEYAKKFTNQKKSAVGKPVEIRVLYKSKSKPPSDNFLVYLLDENDQVIKTSRFIWLVGFNNNLTTMQEGERYTVTGILVEDQGYYGALVVYAKNIKKIADKVQ